jgi:excinuclease ABC subunit C
MPTLKEKVKDLPQQPGVYLFKDKNAKVIYVGKAKSLRHRVTQYFGHDAREQIPFLMADARDLDYTLVHTELEALFLENTLIKQYLPQYNIMLRDDKNYAFITIDYSTEIPQIAYARKIEKNSKTCTYFGPYSSAKKIRQTLDFVRRIFPYCANSEVGQRPCFYYFLHRCPGVCIGKISLEEYGKQLERIALFLSGKNSEVKRQLKKDMAAASRHKYYETAARLRDQLQAIEVLDEKQVMMFPAKVSWDFVSLAESGPVSSVNLFKVREGRLIDKENFIYRSNYMQTAAAILQAFLENYYADASSLPRQVYTETASENPALVGKLLATRTGHKVNLSVPTRGKKLQLITLGKTNAREYLHKWQSTQAANLDTIKKTLEQLKNILNLPAIPRRIEGYDISNIQGTNPVGSMVVAKDGLAAKSEYRKFKINVKQTPDDFAMMREMLSRRLSRADWPRPDLLVIDGGKGQLGVAVELLAEKKLDIPVIGLAKRIEEIFLPGRAEPLVLGYDHPALQLLQRLRDEAHRFAITFHRQLRSKAATKSALDEIPGIGPKAKKLLKEKFGTVAQIRKAPLEDLAAIVGPAKAAQIKHHL